MFGYKKRNDKELSDLHDILEDVNKSIVDISVSFGDRIAFIESQIAHLSACVSSQIKTIESLGKTNLLLFDEIDRINTRVNLIGIANTDQFDFDKVN